jgi:hypothetical protein
MKPKTTKRSTAWERFQRQARKGPVKQSYMLAALGEALRDQADVIDSLAEPLQSETLRSLATISKHAARVIEMHGLTHIGEPATELSNGEKLMIANIPKAGER